MCISRKTDWVGVKISAWRASFGDGSGGNSMHGSVYENSIYGGLSASAGDGIQGSSAGRRVQPSASVLDKAKTLASKAGARGVGSAAPSGGRSIYDVSTSDGL